MPIDFKKDEKEGLVRWKRLRGRVDKGHHVVLARCTNVANPEITSLHLVCECDFDMKPVKRDGKIVGHQHRRDPHACPHKAAVRVRVMAGARKGNAKRWKKLGLKRTILDIHRRSKRGEYFGSHYAEMVYVQEVAEIVGVPVADVWKACNELFAEEKLDLNGAILYDYVRRFRFPVEMQQVIRRIVEEPLGWPNGDAGVIHVAELENRIQEETGCASGKEAFGAKHYPHIDPVILADFAFDWLAITLRRIADGLKDNEVKMDPFSEALKRDLEGRGFAKNHPEIVVDFFVVFVLELLKLSLDRIEIDKAMRPGIAPAQTLTEMADEFAGLAKHCRDKKNDKSR